MIAASFFTIIHFESQTNLSGNLVNVAGKNRLFASTVQVEINRALLHDGQDGRVNDALDALEDNINHLRDGGKETASASPPYRCTLKATGMPLHKNLTSRPHA